MNETEIVAKALRPLMDPVPADERRRSLRTRRPKPVRVQPSDPQYNEEVHTTLNASRDGLRFGTWADHYYIGMPLLITYLDAEDPSSAQHRAEIVRIDRLGHSHSEISVRFVR